MIRGPIEFFRTPIGLWACFAVDAAPKSAQDVRYRVELSFRKDRAMQPTTIADRRNAASRELLLRRVRAEFAEMRCLRLTGGQARRLFGLRPDVCDRVLRTLVEEHALTCGADGRYGVRDTLILQGTLPDGRRQAPAAKAS
jgi:hypothetical protein